MAERRMFSKSIIDSDAFIDMPMSARLLYYDLSMRADDDGFINSPKKVMRITGASMQDLQVLIANKFIIPFSEKGVVVIKHWFIHNYIRKDMYHETNYKEEKANLYLDENKAYTLQPCNELVTNPSTQVRLGKDSIGKDSIGKVIECDEKPKAKRFQPPTLEEVQSFIIEKGYNVNAEHWFNYYQANGWKVGRNSMKDWHASIRYWATKDNEKPKAKSQGINWDEV